MAEMPERPFCAGSGTAGRAGHEHQATAAGDEDIGSRRNVVARVTMGSPYDSPRTAVYGTVRTVVWEERVRKDPVLPNNGTRLFVARASCPRKDHGPRNPSNCGFCTRLSLEASSIMLINRRDLPQRKDANDRRCPLLLKSAVPGGAPI